MAESKSTPEEKPRSIARRDALRWLGSAVIGAELASWLGCSGSEGSNDAGGDSGTTGEKDENDASSGEEHLPWARGGTAAMTALASYPDPFDAIVDAGCTPTCQMILGPCHDDQAPEREDISEGQPGLPMRFALRVLDENCEPVTDADVDIWHCDAQGVYSSETSDSPKFCTGDNKEALAARWFRGHCAGFPGWYSGRAIHVHFTVRRPNREGQEYLTGQLAFPASLIQELCTTHPDYAGRGLPDTANTSDDFFPARQVTEYEMTTQRMPDGALLASKTIIVRTALSGSVCLASDSTGAGG